MALEQVALRVFAQLRAPSRFAGGEANLLVAAAGDDGHAGLVARGYICPAVTTPRFYAEGILADDVGKFGSDDLMPSDLVEHVRRAVQAGIHEEGRTLGDNRTADGPVDVVLVDEAGARFV